MMVVMAVMEIYIDIFHVLFPSFLSVVSNISLSLSSFLSALVAFPSLLVPSTKKSCLLLRFEKSFLQQEEGHPSGYPAHQITYPMGSSGSGGGVNPNTVNILATDQLLIVFLGVAGAFGIYNVTTIALKHMRRLAAMSNDRQKYFAQRNVFSDVKKHMIDAPLGLRRMNNGLSFKRLQLGAIPSRLQSLLLLALVGINIYLLVRDLPEIPLAVKDLTMFYTKAATLGLTNAIPLFLFAGRQNLLITLLGIDFNTFVTMHRWIGRIVVSLILVHVISFFYSYAQESKLVYCDLQASD